MKLYHFSERGDIDVFHPRAPLKHPEAQAFVYAIDEAHCPLYLFPRDCPRVAVWSSAPDMTIFIDSTWEAAWRQGDIWRYEMPPETFIDCQDAGTWVSAQTVSSLQRTHVLDLPGITWAMIQVVESLVEKALQLYDPEAGRFLTSSHVSMIRMANLPGWVGPRGNPIKPQV